MKVRSRRILAERARTPKPTTRTMVEEKEKEREEKGLNIEELTFGVEEEF